MKRKLLLLMMLCTYGIGNVFADVSPLVVFYIYPPSESTGNYTNDFAVVSQGWSVPDMLDPANAIIGDLAIAYDATDSLICDPPVVNTDEIDGKVAVLWRGACEFGAKALACQEAGAIAVVIVNHSGEPVGMGAGVEGPNVTIPTVMVSTSTGALIYDALEAGETLTIFHGNKTGYYGNDIGLKPENAVRAAQYSSLLPLSQDDTEFDIPMGAWVNNFGSNDQTGIVLSAEVSLGGDVLYAETATTAVDITSGDSVFVSLPLFSAASYETGIYDMAYTVVSDSTDEFEADNMEAPNFAFSDTLYTYSSYVDEADGPTNLSFSQPSGMQTEAQHCINFMDPNASRIAVKGMTFAMSTNATSIDGEVAEIYVYEWNMEFEDLDDTLNYDQIDDADLDLLSSGLYEYVGPDMEGENVYAEFEDLVILDDGARYLFCVYYENNEMFLGHDSPKTAYQATQDAFLQPLFSTNADGSWNLFGFGANTTPGIALNAYDVNTGIDEEVTSIDVTPYPNPAVDNIQIPLKDVSGLTQVQIFDVTGKLVETLSINVTPGEVVQYDVSNLDAGVYTFGLRYENGNVSNFNVVINK